MTKKVFLSQLLTLGLQNRFKLHEGVHKNL